MLHDIFSEGYSGTFWEHILKGERLKYFDYQIFKSLLSTRPGRTGMMVTPLVFETSASTDSAIWASFLIASAKVHIFFNSARNTDKKVEKKFSNTI